MSKVFNCPDCPGTLILKTDNAGRLAYLCTRKGCRGRLGAHQETGEPLGVPADARTRGLRKDAHEVFDRIWKTKKMKRKEAYAWLRKKMELEPGKGHINIPAPPPSDTTDECDVSHAITLVDATLRFFGPASCTREGAFL